MSDRPLVDDSSSARAETAALKSIILAALVALLLVLGWRMFILDEKNVDANAPQPSTQAPAAADLPMKPPNQGI